MLECVAAMRIIADMSATSYANNDARFLSSAYTPLNVDPMHMLEKTTSQQFLCELHICNQNL